MPKISYVQPDGSRKTIEVPVGTSLMQAAVSQGIDGIVGECGGSCMCATCHVHIAPGREADLPPISETEAEMLDFAADGRVDESRLGCQLLVTEAFEGLVVRVPATQV